MRRAKQPCLQKAVLGHPGRPCQQASGKLIHRQGPPHSAHRSNLGCRGWEGVFGVLRHFFSFVMRKVSRELLREPVQSPPEFRKHRTGVHFLPEKDLS